MDTADFISRLLDVLERDVIPMTARGVALGNKLFGAAILRKSDLSVVVAETNKETENPLWHGEMHAIKRFFELPTDQRPATKDCVFLTSHEPCSLCLSGITWSGFDNFYYLFTYEDSRDSFGIPYTFSDPMVLSLSLHKAMTKRVLRDLGIPTPDFALIESAEAASAAQAASVAQQAPSPRNEEPKRSAHPTPAWLDSLVKE